MATKKTFAQLLNQQGVPLVKTIVYQLNDPKKEFFVFNGEKITKQEAENALRGWANANYPEIFPRTYFLTEDYSLPVFLSSLLKEIQAAQPEQSLPAIDKLAAWQKALEEDEQWRDTLAYASSHDLDYLSQLDLENQLKLINQVQQQTKAQVQVSQSDRLNKLQTHWQTYLPNEQQEEILSSIVEHVTQEVVNAQQEIEHQSLQEPETSKQERNSVVFNQDFFQLSLQGLCEQDQEIAAALPVSERRKLAAVLAESSLTTTDPKTLTKAHRALNEAAIRLDLNREGVITAVGNTLGLEERKAQEYVNLLEANLPSNPSPTTRQTLKAMETSLNDLDVLTNASLVASETDLLAAQRQLAPLIKNYYRALPLAQVEGWQNMPVSKQARLWSKRISKLAKENGWKNLQNLDPVVVENLLRGIGTKKLEQILEQQGEKIKGSTEDEEVKKAKNRKTKLLRLYFKIESLEKLLKDKNLPLAFRLNVRGAAIKAAFLEFSEKVNPFKLSFYNYHMPGPTQFAVGKLKAFNKKWNYLNRETPLGFIFAPFFKIRQADYKFYSWRWKQWGRLVGKISLPGSSKHSFLYQLPNKLKPSHWLRPVYWGRIGAGKAMSWIGSKLGQQALGKAFSFLGKTFLNYTFKGMFKKLLSTGLGLALKGLIGAGTGGIGIVIGVASTLLNSQKIKMLLKTAATGAVILLGAAIGWLASHIFTMAGMILGAKVGGILGFMVGGTFGFALDSLIASMGGMPEVAAAAGKIGGSAAGFLPAAASSFATSSVLGTTIVVSGGSALIGTSVAYGLIQHNTSSAFVSPPDITAEIAPEKKPLIVQKSALPSTAKPGDTITYTISLTTGTGNITEIKLTDDIDQQSLTNIQVNPPASYNPSQINGEIVLEGLELTSPGSTINFSYTVQVKNDIDPNTVIFNKAVVTGLHENQTISQTATFSLNSDGSDIAKRAKEITNNLERGFWDFYNYSPDYPELFDQVEFACCPNHCYSCVSYPDVCEPENCSGNPSDLQKADSLFWCTWLPIKAYTETGHSIGKHLGVGSLKNWFEQQGRFLPSTTRVTDLKPGYVIFFQKQNSQGSTYWAHTGVVCEVYPDGIQVCESNNYCKFCDYTASQQGHVQNKGSLIIGGYGTP